MNPRHRRLLIPGLLIALVVVAIIASIRRADAAEAPDPQASVLSTIQDNRLPEISGMAVSREDPNLGYVVNDSGSRARVYAVDLTSGNVVGMTDLSGAAGFDVEAMAIAPDGRLWVADTGDNERARDSVALYVLDEPGPGDRVITPELIEVRYQDGAVDVEGLLINPDGDVFLISKAFGGRVFQVPTDASGAAGLEAVAGGLPGFITDATFTSDGRAFVMGYRRISELDPQDWSVIQSFAFPRLRQAEAMAVDASGANLLVTTEGLPAPVVQVPIPDPPAPEPTEEPEPEAVSAESTQARQALPQWQVIVVAAGSGVVAVGLLVWLTRRWRHQ